MRAPRFLLQVAGVTLLLTGVWWVLQGAGIIGDPGTSFIAGDRRFLAIGGVAGLIGIALLTYLRKTGR
ncbi:hypothetical protein PF049_09470 [Erythrobacteraceae bacterium WH01K]|nr:hypothetical protein PF049_09470 [Erythrobacteraceae bacterium WH01K]